MTDERKPEGSVIELRVQVGKLEERVAGIDKNLGSQIGGLSQQLTTAMAKFDGLYATRPELQEVDKKVERIAGNLTWAVRCVVGAVLLGLVGLLAKTGGMVHP